MFPIYKLGEMSDSARDRLRRLLGGKLSSNVVPPSPPAPPPTKPLTPPRATLPPVRPPAPAFPAPTPRPSVLVQEKPAERAREAPATVSDARQYLQELRSKMARLAEDFAQGSLNRAQFQEIYAHYQRQRVNIERAMYDMPGSDAWRGVVSTGLTSMLRQRNAAQVLSYSIYDNSTSLPLASAGEFKIDTGLLVPMLSSFRSATREIFGAGMRSTEIEGGRWLCFVPGRFTTLFVLFSVEPARIQLTLIEDLHRDFETANASALARGEGVEAAQQFVQLWALDRVAM